MSKGTRITKRWIDADGIMRACYGSYLTTGNKAYSEIIALVEAAPAADVAEVKHGRWIEADDDGTMDKCSVCGEYSCCRSPYCGECGAKMDEVERNEN